MPADRPVKKREISAVQRTFHAEDILLCNMSIDHGSLKVLVAEEFLNSPYVVSLFKEVRGKTMSESVNRRLLGDAGRNNCFLKRLLEGTWMRVMPPPVGPASPHGSWRHDSDSSGSGPMSKGNYRVDPGMNNNKRPISGNTGHIWPE